MPLRIILHNPRAGLIISNSIGAMITNSVTFNIPLYFQAVLLESATNSGLRLIVPTICGSAFGTATGFLITWTRLLKTPLVAGTILLLIGTTSLVFMTRGLPSWAYLLFLAPSSMGAGFMFPATFMAVLAVSEQSEQAVVTSTLILWRSVGMVLGVAASSLVLQNALLFFLEKNVTGPEKEDVRSSPPLSPLQANHETRSSPGSANPSKRSRSSIPSIASRSSTRTPCRCEPSSSWRRSWPCPQ
jgi:hypothetical protein